MAKTRGTKASAKRNPKSAGRSAGSKVSATADISDLLPLHHKLYLVLRQRLLEGTFPSDRPIPGEHQLATEFDVSRVTVRRTLARLQEEGLIDRRHGVGTFPSRPAAETNRASYGVSYYEHLTTTSAKYKDEVLEFAYVPTPFPAAMRENFGAVALKVVRLSFLNRQVMHILRSHIPADLGQTISRASLGNRTLLDVLGKQGVLTKTSQLTVNAVAADGEDARLLAVPVGAPLVQAVRRSYDGEGRLIEHNQTLSRSDRFAYRFVMNPETGLLQSIPSG